MPNTGDSSQSRRHSLSDWLTLHELDAATCRGILDGIGRDAAAPDAPANATSEHQALDLETAWQRTADAMRTFLPEQRAIIDDTFEKTTRIVVDRPDASRKALTLDNGPTAYPTILYSYRGDPADCLIIAHEFAHALQIRASGRKFVPPVVREVCAFLGEGALLSYTRNSDAARYAGLAQAWRRDSARYFGVQRDRLRAVVGKPDEPYKYSWNYPIARHVAVQIAERCSRDWIWRVFEGTLSVRDVLRELSMPASQREDDAQD